MFSKALVYYKKALAYNQDLKDKAEMAGDYVGIGLAYYNMGNYDQALENFNKALDINTEINNKVEIVRNYYQMSFPLYKMNRKGEDALQQLYTAKTILLDFEKETRYSYPLLKDVEDRISFIEKDKK